MRGDGGEGRKEDGPNASEDADGEFLVIPAVSLKKGRVVVVNAGQYEPLTDVDDRELSLYDFSELFLDRYETVLVLDIDGIERRRPQLPLIQTVAPLKNVWWDPGVRNLEDMMDAFTAGANRVVVGTKTIWSKKELKACQEFSADFVLGLDWSEGILSRDATISQVDPIDFLQEMHKAGVRRVLFSQFGRVRTGARIDMGFVNEMTSVTRRLYLGGSGFNATTAQFIKNAGLGIRGVVVGIMDIIRDSIIEEGSEYDEGALVLDGL
jgi:phosphoribosylformimino-5-aminoimidazole carboxamide ribonucleotide (ProFAR) isomerase